LEDKIISHINEEEKRENILTSHLKEIFEDLNNLEGQFSEQERILEEEIVYLNSQLEKSKRNEEVVNI